MLEPGKKGDETDEDFIRLAETDDDPLTIAVIQPANGFVEISNAGTPIDTTNDFLIYSPNVGFHGEDTITYTATDIWGASVSETLGLTVDPVNQAPTAQDDSAELVLDTIKTVHVLANDADPEDDTLTIDSVTQGQHGTVAIVGDDVTYEPDTGFSGSDFFTYTISDGNGGVTTATVNVVVRPAGQWADGVLAVTSGEDTADNVLDAADDTAWMPSGENMYDALTVNFVSAAPATGVLIKQDGGMVQKIELLEANGTAHTIWVSNTPLGVGGTSDLVFDFAETGYDVAALRVTVGQGSAGIEAVRLLTGGSASSLAVTTAGLVFSSSYRAAR